MAAAADGKLEPRDSELKDKAEELGRDVNSGAMTSGEGLNELSKGRSYPLYAKAVNLIEQDLPFWSGIADKAGTDEVDTLMAGIIGAPVPGSFIFAKNAANAKSDVQKVSGKMTGLPSGKTPDDVKDRHDKWRKAIKKKAFDYKNDYEKNYTDDKFTKVNGNTMDTKATLYSDDNEGRKTQTGEIFGNHNFTAAIQPLYRGVGNAYARITNLDDPRKSVVLKANDSGPYTPIVFNRYIDKNGKKHEPTVNLEDPTKGVDLSVAAYNAITDDAKKGTLHVKVEFISPKEGQAAIDEQVKNANEHKAKFDKDVHKTLCMHDSVFRNNPKNNCPNK
ncbi:MAG: septal ring lytic transglycosylase RlpA family protein [Candidatus Magnetominusculus sp. LBB02]|nr:septal ring lytic transglycosylase RlpA family protein [Candidatus Magnetominusculus sp. LBB02]